MVEDHLRGGRQRIEKSARSPCFHRHFSTETLRRHARVLARVDPLGHARGVARDPSGTPEGLPEG